MIHFVNQLQLRRSTRIFGLLVFLLALPLLAQSNSNSISGTVTDSTGAVIPNATLTLTNPTTGYSQTAKPDASGHYIFNNVPAHAWRISIAADGFTALERTLVVHAGAPITQDFSLAAATVNQVVNVEAGMNNAVEQDPSAHTDIDLGMIDRVLSAPTTSGLSDLITQSSPGVAADSNGMFHPLGEHSDTTYSVDGQNISDQQSRTFSPQMSSNAISSVQVLDGVIPAEYGDKASLVAVTTTKSGIGANGVHGSLSLGYGTFGSSNTGFTLSTGNDRYGNFIATDALNSSRFLDSPEFVVMHDKGNQESVFDRGDWKPRASDSLQLNLAFAHSWFQQPNQFDQQTAGQDQRQENKNFNISPMWTHIYSQSTVLNASAYVRQDRVQYYPSANPFADSPATLAQTRRLTNAGIKSDLNYIHGIHSFKFGGNFYHTFLSEAFDFGITDPNYNAPGSPNFSPGLAPYDLTRGGHLFQFHGRTDIKQESLYAEDNINWRAWNFLVGGRADNYNGISSRSMLEPRLGATYHVKPTGTVLRVGYSKLFPTPYNENLILSSSTGPGGLPHGTGVQAEVPLKPAKRNQFNAGFEQGAGRIAVISADYFWKFTQRDYDFDVLFNTPLTFPIQWQQSKIDGVEGRVSFSQHKGLQGYVVMGHTRARFFAPEVGGLIFNSPLATGPFRIDHDQAYEQTTFLQYQPKKNGPWASFNWRFDSGAVAGSLPCYGTGPSNDCPQSTMLNGQPAILLQNGGIALSADQEYQAGLSCGSFHATSTTPIPNGVCLASQLGSTLLRIPAPGTENDDKNPPRVDPRSLIDTAAGWDNVLHHFTHSDHYRTGLSFNVSNLTNKYALYNYLSTFSGTHYTSPRAVSGQVSFNF